MNQVRLLRIGISICIALCALGAALFALEQPAAHADPLTTRVYPSASCPSTLQACINGSSNGDSINIQAGTYITSITLNKPVTLAGAGSATTILKALPNQRVITVTGAAITNSTIISGLTIANGHALGDACPAGCGGGMLFTGAAQPFLSSLVITNNVADHDGGGIFADTDSPIRVDSSTIISNSSGNSGGGIYGLDDVVLTTVTVRKNHTL